MGKRSWTHRNQRGWDHRVNSNGARTAGNVIFGRGGVSRSDALRRGWGLVHKHPDESIGSIERRARRGEG